VIAVDTNVVVRLLTSDDKQQAARTEALFGVSEIFISDTVVLETAWVLTSAYGFGHDQIVGALRRLLGLPNVRVADPARLRQALDWAAGRLDIADALHLATSQSAEAFVTFDQELIRRAADIESCPVLEPAPSQDR
jgi:predicted nucleic-acid-binding protein